ncbi:MAG TPA: epimerase, partial [Candidatus Marinimicrobia bacterium]|nr:epimerase [Candidatus Neomarinimicrobiota bacterium]
NLYNKSKILFKVSDKRQAIVDSWPAELNDIAARKDWGWEPRFDFDSAFDNYLVPEINKRYGE